MFLLPGQSLCHSRNLSSYETRSREAAKAAQTAGQAGQENNKDKGTFKMYSLLNTSPVSNEHTNNDASSSPQHHSVSFLLDTIKEDGHNDSLNQQFSTGLQFVQHDINYDLAQHAVLSPDLVLLDTQSSINIFKNPSYIARLPMHTFSNRGHQDSHLEAMLPGIGKVWFNPNSLANILCFADVEDTFPITYIQAKRTFRVHVTPDKFLNFTRISPKLYIYTPPCPTPDVF